MNIIFPPIDEKYIRSKIEDGYYSNATELVRDAVRRLRESDEARLSRLLFALEQGKQDLAAGRSTAWTTDLLNEIEAEAMDHAAKRLPPGADV